MSNLPAAAAHHCREDRCLRYFHANLRAHTHAHTQDRRQDRHCMSVLYQKCMRTKGSITQVTGSIKNLWEQPCRPEKCHASYRLRRQRRTLPCYERESGAGGKWGKRARERVRKKEMRRKRPATRSCHTLLRSAYDTVSWPWSSSTAIPKLQSPTALHCLHPTCVSPLP